MRFAMFMASVIVPVVFAADGALADPSFDCAAARQVDEKTICADPLLSAIDAVAAEAFAAYEPSFRNKAQVARDLLKDRAVCGDDRACIAAVQYGSLFTFTYGNDEFHQPPPWIETYATALTGHKAAQFSRQGGGRDLPSKPGGCAKTRIKSITTRFGEPASYENQNEGTAVEFENGGYQVSYERGDEFANVAAGQDVVICLMNIPRDCPGGDERGRIYYTLDLKTQTQWVLPDSQHLCGGA